MLHVSKDSKGLKRLPDVDLHIGEPIIKLRGVVKFDA